MLFVCYLNVLVNNCCKFFSTASGFRLDTSTGLSEALSCFFIIIIIIIF